MPLDENEAWQRMQAAILRCQADPSEHNLAQVRRWSRALSQAWGLVPADDDEPSEREAA